MQTTRETVKEVAAFVPPVAVSATTWFGLPWQQWVYILTAAYTLIQILRLVPKCYGCLRCFIDHRTCPRTCKD